MRFSVVLAKGLQAVLCWDERDTMPRLALPVTAITGTLDRVTKPDALRDVSCAARDAYLVEVPRNGHLGLFQDGEAYARAIEAAIERVVGRGV